MINDYELLYMIHQNDECSLIELMNKYGQKTNCYLSKYYGLNRAGYEKCDLIQMAKIKLMECVWAFREEKEVAFEVFYFLSLKRLVIDAVRTSTGIKETCFDTIYENKEKNQVLYSTVTETSITNQMYIKERANAYLAAQNETEQEIIRLRMLGYRYQEIADRMQIKKKKVEYVLSKCRKCKGFID